MTGRSDALEREDDGAFVERMASVQSGSVSTMWREQADRLIALAKLGALVQPDGDAVERVARAIHFASDELDLRSAFSPLNDAHWRHWWIEEREHHERVARAALAAAPVQRGPDFRASMMRDRLADALRGMLRLSDMGFEESMREPEENGNYAAYTRAKEALNAYNAAVTEAKRIPAAPSQPFDYSFTDKHGNGPNLATAKHAAEMDARGCGGRVVPVYAAAGQVEEWQSPETAPKDGTAVDLWVRFETGERRVADAVWHSDAGEPANWWNGDRSFGLLLYAPVVLAWRLPPSRPEGARP